LVAGRDNGRMFRQRLRWAFACLALASLLQGALAWWAIDAASAQVVRGRVASDLLKGHLQLSASKQRLRSWTSQALLGAGANPAERDGHLAEMRRTLDALQALAQTAFELDPGHAQAASDWQERQKTLGILRRSVNELDAALRDVQALPANANPAAAWDAIKRVFDASQGQDLRELVAQTVAREQAAVERERQGADRALTTLAGGAVMATLAVGLMAALMALYFAKALRQPLHNLSAGAQALQRGELQHRMDERGHDEFAMVAHTLNTMAQELQQHREREAQARHGLEQQVQARTAELEQALQALQQLDASRRQLFADISHELRTPTTAIRGEAEIALRGKTKSAEEYQDTLARIASTASQLGRVIDDLLTMARSQTQALAIVPSPTAVRLPVQEALQQLDALAQAHTVALHWHNDAPEDQLLWCDGARLRQLLVLLLDNAIRYSHPGGQVTLHTRLHQGHWQAQVQDQGIGIAPPELAQVFERNFRGEQARKHRADGVGLGLPLAKTLAQAHGGRLTLTSAAGQGTTATLDLPLQGETDLEHPGG
jgi:two-component system, OmpR family, sensor kinase